MKKVCFLASSQIQKNALQKAPLKINLRSEGRDIIFALIAVFFISLNPIMCGLLNVISGPHV